MNRLLTIISTSLKTVFQELGKNKLRSFLSLFGVTIGIFCIISVLATVNSLERNIRAEMAAFGNNTIYIDKWQYSASGPDYPYWRYAKRPVPKYAEIAAIKERTVTAKYVAFKINTNSNIEANNLVANNIRIYGITEDFSRIQSIEIAFGRYRTAADFHYGTNAIVLGNNSAEQLFGEPENSLQKIITIKGKKATVVGVTKKQGRQLLGGWGFDESVITSYNFGRTFMYESKADPLILVRAKDRINNKTLTDDLTGAMRALHKLRPSEENDFALNDINDFSTILTKTFRSVNLGGWAIGALAFIVGIFGVANIMFVSVKERTTQIGIKKALGAKRRMIMMDFLLESALLCILGGLVGLILVFILTQVVTYSFDFPIFLSLPIIATALLISILAGVLAGIIPASKAARLDPVVAIRS